MTDAMQFTDFSRLDTSRLPSPCYVVDEVAIERNLRILQKVAEESGAVVLSALKAFAMWRPAPLVSRYLGGTCASGLHEARLGRECYGGELHVFEAWGVSIVTLRQATRLRRLTTWGWRTSTAIVNSILRHC